MQNSADSLRNSDISSGVCFLSKVKDLLALQVFLLCAKCCFNFLLYVWTVLAWKFTLFLIVMCWNVYVAICPHLSLPCNQRKKLDRSQWSGICRSGAISCGSCPPPQRTQEIISVGCRATLETQCLMSTSRPSPCPSHRRRHVSLPARLRKGNIPKWNVAKSTITELKNRESGNVFTGFVHLTELNCSFHEGNWSWWQP